MQKLRFHVVLLVALFFSLCLTGFGTNNSYDISKNLLQLYGVGNTPIEIFGKTSRNSINFINCKNLPAQVSDCEIVLPSQEALRLRLTQLELCFKGKNLMRAPVALAMNRSSIHIKEGNVVFDGEIKLDHKSQLSISLSAGFFAMAKQADGIHITKNNVKNNNKNCALLCLSLNDAFSAQMNVHLTNVTTQAEKIFSLKPGYQSFAVSLPAGKYELYLEDGNQEKYFPPNKIVTVTSYTALKNVPFSHSAPVQIEKINITPPSEYGANDGSIVPMVQGGSGKYQYYLGTKQIPSGTITSLSAGKYLLKVEDCNSGDYCEQEFIIPQPHSTKITAIRINGVTYKMMHGDYFTEQTFPQETTSANIFCELLDERASFALDTLDMIPLAYGQNIIPFTVTSGKLTTSYCILLNREPPTPTIHGIPAGWTSQLITATLSSPVENSESYYKINNQPLQCANSFTLSNSGIYDIEAYTQKDGVKSQTHTFEAKIDRDIPTVHEAKVEALADESFVCRASISDEHSGINKVVFTLGNNFQKQAQIANGTASFPVPKNFRGNISIYAVDNCGNKSTTFVLKGVQCDTEQPSILYTFPKDDCLNSQLSTPIVTFNEDIQIGPGNILLTTDNGAPVRVDQRNIATENNTAKLNIPLDYGHQYSITIHEDSFTDSSGNPLCLNSPYTFSFTTPVSPNNANLGTLALNGNSFDVSTPRKHFIFSSEAVTSVQLKAIPKNKEATVTVTLYSQGKKIAPLRKGADNCYVVGKDLLKLKNKRIIIDVLSQNCSNQAVYGIDLPNSVLQGNLNNHSKLSLVKCENLHSAKDLSALLQEDKNAHLRLIVSPIAGASLGDEIKAQLQQSPTKNYSAFQLAVEQVSTGVPKQLDKFLPVIVTFTKKPEQEFFQVVPSNPWCMFIPSQSLLIPITPEDATNNTVTVTLRKTTQIIVYENSVIKQTAPQNTTRTHKSFKKPFSSSEVMLCEGEEISSEKLEYLIKNNLPLNLKINGKEYTLYLKDSSPLPLGKELTYKEILSAYNIEVKTENPPTGCYF